MSFKDKVVLVTGAARGIGAAISVAFAKKGANVALVDRDKQKLTEAGQKFAGMGKTLLIHADVSIDDDANRIVKTTVDNFGKLDVLVNNAAISGPGTVMDGRLVQIFDEIIGTNIRAPMQLTCLAAPHLIETKGNIVNISTIAGQFTPSIPEVLPYSVTKAALNRFTSGSALELAEFGVRVNAVSPGPVYTDILERHRSTWNDFKEHTALDRVCEPEEVANLVLYLASDKAVGITGSNFIIDNGSVLRR